jgi:DHA1 family multidrug resistance protein-like MFS transporter
MNVPRLSRESILPFSMFFGSFAWSFVFVSLPFYIQKMSTVDATATLRWTGWILGVSSLVTVVTAPFSARLFGERHPKRSYVLTQLLQGSGFFLMALARTLPELFFSRMLLGFMGAVSTFAFIMVGRSGGDVRRGVASIQSGMTLGQVLGPAAGAFAAARIGFRGSFIVAGFMLWACSAMVAWGTPYRPVSRAGHERPHTASVREVTTVCLLVLAGSIQIFFLTAILPQVLPRLGVPPAMTLEVGGLVLFVTGAAAALGSFIAPRLGEIVGDRRTIVWFLVASSVGLGALALAPGVWSFGFLRFVQVLCISPVFPLSVAAIAQRASGTAIGIVNSSRIGAAFLGPVIATTLLAWMPPAAVYLVLAAIGLSVVPLLAGLSGRGRAAKEIRA